MQIKSCWLVTFFLAIISCAFAMQSSNLVGTWVGKVQGFDVEMSFVLRADGSAEYEGALGSWRVQGNRLLLTQEGETVVYNFVLQGSTLTISGGDLMAPMVMRRASGGSVPAPPEAESNDEIISPPTPTAKAGASAGTGKRPLSEPELTSLLEGGVPSRRLVQLVEERGVAFPVNGACVSRLKAKGATNALISALQNGTSRATPKQAEATSPTYPPGSAQPQDRPAATGIGSGQSRGRRFAYDQWGISFVMPPGWKAGERQGLLLLGSDVEPGLIIVRLARKATLEQLVRDYNEGMQDEGAQLMPTVQAQSFPAGQNRAVAGEMAGIAQDGARIRARTVAVASPFGDAVVVLGMTTEEKYSGLKPRVESISTSFQFSQPQAPPVLEAIAGQWFYISSSSFGSSERYLNLCSDGRFSEDNNIYSSGSAGTAYGGSGQSAQWSAEGGGGQGTITVTYPNGKTSQFEYQMSGGDLLVGGRKYARYGDGSCTKTSVY